MTMMMMMVVVSMSSETFVDAVREYWSIVGV